jgi:hypothetical protein
MANDPMALLIACVSILAADSPIAPNVSVAASYVAEPEPALLFEVRAEQNHTVFESDLPWGNFYSVRLRFRDASGKDVCPLLKQPIDDPSDDQVTLTAGQVLSGRVSLVDRCQSLATLRSQGPIVVEWTYTPVVHKPKANKLHGSVMLPESR